MHMLRKQQNDFFLIINVKLKPLSSKTKKIKDNQQSNFKVIKRQIQTI